MGGGGEEEIVNAFCSLVTFTYKKRKIIQTNDAIIKPICSSENY